MQKVQWFLISLVTLALILSSSLAFAWGGGQGNRNNCPYGAAVSQQSGQGQRKNNQSQGQSGRGYLKGRQQQGSAQSSRLSSCTCSASSSFTLASKPFLLPVQL